MTCPVSMVVDDDPGNLGTLDAALRSRHERDYVVIAQASPAAARPRLACVSQCRWWPTGMRPRLFCAR